MKKTYTKAGIINRNHLQLNESVAGCSVATEQYYQIWSMRDQVDGYTLQEVINYMREIVPGWNPDGWNTMGEIIMPCYNVTVTFPAGTNPENEYQTSLSFFYEDWIDDGIINDFRASEYADECYNWNDAKAKGWKIATASQEGDFLEEMLGENLGGRIDAFNS